MTLDGNDLAVVVDLLERMQKSASARVSVFATPSVATLLGSQTASVLAKGALCDFHAIETVLLYLRAKAPDLSPDEAKRLHLLVWSRREQVEAIREDLGRAPDGGATA